MRRSYTLLAAVAVIALSGCGHLELAPEGDLARVLVGRVQTDTDIPLPSGAEVTVRIVEPAMLGMPPRILGSQTIRNPGATPVDFRVEYQADDETLRRGLNIEARISWGGTLRFYNRNGYAVSLGNATDVHRVSVNPAGP